MNKFIKEQLEKSNVIIRYKDGREVDLGDISDCEFILKREEKLDIDLSSVQQPIIEPVVNPQINKWPSIVIKRRS